MQLSGLDRQDDLFCLSDVAFVEVNPAVYPFVRAFLAFCGPRPDEPERQRIQGSPNDAPLQLD